MRCSRRAQNHPWRKVETKQTYYGWRFHSLSTCAASLSLFWTRTPLASLFLYARCAGEDSKHYLLLCKEDRQAGGCGGGRVKVPQEISWTGKKKFALGFELFRNTQTFPVGFWYENSTKQFGTASWEYVWNFLCYRNLLLFFCSPKYVHES